jgi:hypothetical protein
MALSAKSLFLYGFQVTQANSSIDFRAVALETPRQATLRLGFYSLTSLGEEIKRAMQAMDPTRVYTVTVDRTVNGGLENRVTISTSGAFLSLLFLTGPRNASSACFLIGFTQTDKTGFLTYTGSSSAGTVFVPSLSGFNFLAPEFYQKNFGAVNVSASGEKEAVVFQIQEFWQVQFKYVPKAEFLSGWNPLLRWMIQQRGLEFTPEVSSPGTFYEGTLESTQQDGKGLMFIGTEMLPSFPNVYDTGLLRFRKRIIASTFI